MVGILSSAQIFSQVELFCKPAVHYHVQDNQVVV